MEEVQNIHLVQIFFFFQDVPNYVPRRIYVPTMIVQRLIHMLIVASKRNRHIIGKYCTTLTIIHFLSTSNR